MRKRVLIYNIGDGQQLDAWRRQGADYYQEFAVAKPSPVVCSTGRRERSVA